MIYKCYGLTDVGMVRNHNEDGFVIGNELIQEGEYELAVESPFWAVVADGMGGENAGDVASQLALECFAGRETMVKEKDELKSFVEKDVQQKLFSHMQLHPETRGMGSTLAGIVSVNNRVLIFHVGDSRVYRLRDGFLKPLTKDHSLVQSLYESGQITLEEKRTHPQRNVILRSLGQTNLEVDITELPASPADLDLFVLCSDGLIEYVTDEEMEGVLSTDRPLKLQAQELVNLAKERGGLDNITIVLVQCVMEGES